MRPQPLVLSFHSWGYGLGESSSLMDHARDNGYTVAAPKGYADDQINSWNGAGTTSSPGLLGATCYDREREFDYCYASCGACADSCSWTTCEDSVAQVSALLDEVLSSYCVDASRVFATGVSNGGVFIYALATDPRTAGRFAGFAPVIGLPHAGFNVPPSSLPAPLLGIWGRRDITMPPLPNPAAVGHLIQQSGVGGAGDGAGDGLDNVAAQTSLDTRWGGWRFTTARATTVAWARANGCEGASAQPEPFAPAWAAGFGNSSCAGWRRCPGGAEVLECLHGGGHSEPAWREAALLDFMRRHAAPAARLPSARPIPLVGGVGPAWRPVGDARAAGIAVGVALLCALLLLSAFAAVWFVRRRRRRQRLLSAIWHRGIVPRSSSAAADSSDRLPSSRLPSGRLTSGSFEMTPRVVKHTPSCARSDPGSDTVIVVSAKGNSGLIL